MCDEKLSLTLPIPRCHTLFPISLFIIIIIKFVILHTRTYSFVACMQYWISHICEIHNVREWKEKVANVRETDYRHHLPDEFVQFNRQRATSISRGTADTSCGWLDSIRVNEMQIRKCALEVVVVQNSNLRNSSDQNCMSECRTGSPEIEKEQNATTLLLRKSHRWRLFGDMVDLLCSMHSAERRRIIIIISMGHFPLTFEYFHSKFNNFELETEDEGTEKYCHPYFVFHPILLHRHCHCHFLRVAVFRFRSFFISHLCLFCYVCVSNNQRILFILSGRNFAYIYIQIEAERIQTIAHAYLVVCANGKVRNE